MPLSLHHLGPVEHVFHAHKEELYRSIAGSVRKRLRAPGARAVDDLAEEAYSRTVVTALERADRYDPDRGCALVWVKGIAFHTVKGLFRDEGRSRRRTVDPYRGTAKGEEGGMGTDDERISRLPGAPVIETAYDDTKEAVERLLAAARPADRELLRLIYLEELPQEEVARRLGMTPGAVYTRLSRIRARLRRDFQAEC